MRAIHFIAILASGMLFTGCAQLGRPIADAAFAATGAWVGHAVSDGNALATAGGAMAGVGVSEGFFALKTRGERQALDRGFIKGRSDGIKEIYWNLQEEQRNAIGATQTFEVNIPEHRTGGVLLKPTPKTIGR